MKVTRVCDVCHQEKELFFFKTVDGGYVAYCKEDAVKMGYAKPERKKEVGLRRITS